MNNGLRIACVALVVGAACGPRGQEDSASEATTSAESSGGLDSGAQPTSGAQRTSGDESSTGSDASCLAGQAPLSAMWTHAGESVWPQQMELGDNLVALADGRLAVVAMSMTEKLASAPALMFLSATGEPLETHFGAFTSRGFTTYTVAIDAADQPVTLSYTAHEESSKGALLSRFASDGAVLAEVELEFPDQPGVLALADVPVVAGFDNTTKNNQLAKVDPVTGTPIWQVELAGPQDLGIQRIAVGPQGELVVGGGTALGIDGPAQMFFWRFTGDGALVWHRRIDAVASEEVTDLQFTPDGELLVLHGGPWPQPRVELLALAAADGATLWQRLVAEPTIANGGPWAEDFHLDDASITVPVTRVRAPSLGDPGKDRSLEVHRFSLQGEPLGVTAIAGPGSTEGSARTRSVRGLCGQLVLSAPSDDDAPWLTGLAP